VHTTYGSWKKGCALQINCGSGKGIPLQASSDKNVAQKLQGLNSIYSIASHIPITSL
jgi:hypothetical protein